MIDGEAVVFRPDNTSDFEALRSREGQAGAILVAYELMEANGQDFRPEPLEERRKRLAKLLSRSNKALRDGIQLSEAITGDGGRHLSSAREKKSGVPLLFHSRRLTRSLQMEIRWIEHGCFVQPVQIVDRAMPLL